MTTNPPTKYPTTISKVACFLSKILKKRFVVSIKRLLKSNKILINNFKHTNDNIYLF